MKCNSWLVIAVFLYAALPAAPPQHAGPPRNETMAALPMIPNATLNLADYGAVGDGKTFNTEAFQKVIAALAAAGGGHLIVPHGTYKTLPISLVSVKWNGTQKNGPLGGMPDVFY